MMAADLTAVARDYLRSLERGDLEAMLRVYDPGAIQIEHPNRLKPQGDRRDLDRMVADFERGRALLASQRYEVLSASASGETVAMQVLWTGVLAVPLGGLAAGDSMRARCAIFLEFRDGRIVTQQNYDCFEAFEAAA